MAASGPARGEFAEWQMQLHGHRVFCRTVGQGPPVVLIHGMVNSSRHWRSVALRLAENHLVVAPDLLGHGDSATPRGDYSLGAHATFIRDLLTVMGVGPATIVGHSLGGGVAMQFFYQFPGRTQRLVLVSSGGLGDQVSPLLRSAALPGAGPLLRVAAHPRVVGAMRGAGVRLQGAGRAGGPAVQAVARALGPLAQPGSRDAFLQTLRAVIDVRGQRVSARDRLYLLGHLPTMIVWGERDRTIPLAHGRMAAQSIPHSRLETLPRAAHFPHLEDPEGLARVLTRFISETEPASLGDDDWAEILAPRSFLNQRTAESAPGR